MGHGLLKLGHHKKMISHLPEVCGVVDLTTAEQLPHEVDYIGFEMALVYHCVQHAGTECPTAGKLRLE